MSSPLKKKSKERNKINRYIGVGEDKSKYAMEKKEDNIIITASTSVSYMTYLALLDVLGFKQKRLKRFYEDIQNTKLDWSKNNITTQEMKVYCEKHGIKCQEWMRSIPNSQKMELVKPYSITTPYMMKYLDAAILSMGMMTAIVLKEIFRISISNINKVLEKIKFSISCYATKQPISKKPYLNDETILQIFRDEIKLDLVTGNKVS